MSCVFVSATDKYILLIFFKVKCSDINNEHAVRNIYGCT